MWGGGGGGGGSLLGYYILKFNACERVLRLLIICNKFRAYYTAISIKVVHEQSGKVEYERERLLGIANKLMNFQSYSKQPFALVFDFSALLVDNLN